MKVSLNELNDIAVELSNWKAAALVTKEVFLCGFADYPAEEASDAYDRLFEKLRMDLKISNEERYAIYISKLIGEAQTVGICDLLTGGFFTGYTVPLANADDNLLG